MKYDVTTVPEYLKAIPADRRKELEPVLQVIRKNLPKGFEEAIGFGMINWQVPLKKYPVTYNKLPLMYAALASQKNNLAVYMMGIYGDTKRAKKFVDGFAKAGKKLDKGKSCIRFKKADDLALAVIGEAIGEFTLEEYIAYHEKGHPPKKTAKK